MRLALACVFLLLAASCISLASHGLQATTPWEAYQTVLTKIREVGNAAQA